MIAKRTNAIPARSALAGGCIQPGFVGWDITRSPTRPTAPVSSPASHAKAPPEKNEAQHAARKAFDPIADRIKGLIKQIDLLYKLTARVADLGSELASAEPVATAYDRRFSSKLVKQLDEERRAAVEQLKHAAYFHRQVAWLQDRFPKAELEDVPGLVKLVDRSEINEANGWSLTPGRYVGVAPPEEDEGSFGERWPVFGIHDCIRICA
jgi:type I restriction enzyme M protein